MYKVGTKRPQNCTSYLLSPIAEAQYPAHLKIISCKASCKAFGSAIVELEPAGSSLGVYHFSGQGG